MTRFLTLLGFVCLIAMLLPACAPAPEPEPEPAPEPVFDQAAEEAAIRNVAEQMKASFNAHEAKGCVANTDENYENWLGTVKGREAFEKQRIEDIARYPDVQASFLDEIGIVFVTPDVAIRKTRTEWTGMTDAEGKLLPSRKTLDAQVYVKRNGKWLRTAAFFRPIEE